jgi:hypothetical protein
MPGGWRGSWEARTAAAERHPLTELVGRQRAVLQQAKPDRGRVAGAISKFTGYVMEAGKPVVTAVFMMAAQAQGWIPTPGQ